MENKWMSTFGDDYTIRNNNRDLVPNNIALFSEIIKHTNGVKSIIEFGANVGLNMVALRSILPPAELSAVEINKLAISKLVELGIPIYEKSICNFKSKTKYDMSFTKGVLIHIDDVDTAYQTLYNSSKKYICMIEYYNPKPQKIEYRDSAVLLCKRDFAGEFMDKFNDVKLIKYGFVYHRDKNFPLDDITWFLMEK